MESKSSLYIFEKSHFLDLAKGPCKGYPLRWFKLCITHVPARFVAQMKTWTVSISFFIHLEQCSIFKLERNALNIYWSLLQKEQHESCWLKNVLSALGARITRYYSLHLRFLALMSFLMIIARSINFKSIGKMHKWSRFFDSEPKQMWKVREKLNNWNCFLSFFLFKVSVI